MKKIAPVLVLLVVASMLLFGCELFKPQADVSVDGASYSGIAGDPVYVDYRIENTGTMAIAEWSVQFKVECVSGTYYGSDNWGGLDVGQVLFIDDVYVNVGTDQPAHYNTAGWDLQDCSVNEVNLVAE